ncbi:hypothetical protein A0H81_06160 [Grifola frondosa]|uniref:C2H2-type domain-containing protein n=1 Tax=Grifola frondosa TaxID=5627 RepID=A0A1C7MB64_GRIFR|nr:hypothetical protein A0H81_06160 [Grifola frondosa]
MSAPHSQNIFPAASPRLTRSSAMPTRRRPSTAACPSPSSAEAAPPTRFPHPSTTPSPSAPLRPPRPPSTRLRSPRVRLPRTPTRDTTARAAEPPSAPPASLTRTLSPTQAGPQAQARRVRPRSRARLPALRGERRQRIGHVSDGHAVPADHPAQAPPKGARTPAGAGRTNSSKTYSFVSLPGNAVKKRPRRYDEIERLYQCSWPNCTKAYGTLNHLNAHVQMQRHGAKRSPGEFKELRKQWRQAKKEADEAEREREREAHALAAMHHHHHLPHAHELDHRPRPRRRLSVASRTRTRTRTSTSTRISSSTRTPSISISSTLRAEPAGYALQGPGMALDARYHLQSPRRISRSSATPRSPPPQQHQHQQAHPEEGLQEMAQQFYRAGNGGGERARGSSRASGAGGVTLPPLGAFSPQDGAPELVAHVSLGTNRLPPDSTLLTPLPGYEPDAAQEMERRMERMMGQGQHGQGARPSSYEWRERER